MSLSLLGLPLNLLLELLHRSGLLLDLPLCEQVCRDAQYNRPLACIPPR